MRQIVASSLDLYAFVSEPSASPLVSGLGRSSGGGSATSRTGSRLSVCSAAVVRSSMAGGASLTAHEHMTSSEAADSPKLPAMTGWFGEP